MTTAADWRRWAILSVMAETVPHPVKVSELARILIDEGWGDALPSSGHYDAVQRSLLSMEKNGHVRRTGRPARWTWTQLGHDFAFEYVVDNPNITPDRMRR